jgi:hypothetical protein
LKVIIIIDSSHHSIHTHYNNSFKLLIDATVSAVSMSLVRLRKVKIQILF